jgi:hypothetical protein
VTGLDYNFNVVSQELWTNNGATVPATSLVYTTATACSGGCTAAVGQYKTAGTVLIAGVVTNSGSYSGSNPMIGTVTLTPLSSSSFVVASIGSTDLLVTSPQTAASGVLRVIQSPAQSGQQTSLVDNTGAGALTDSVDFTIQATPSGWAAVAAELTCK